MCSLDRHFVLFVTVLLIKSLSVIAQIDEGRNEIGFSQDFIGLLENLRSANYKKKIQRDYYKNEMKRKQQNINRYYSTTEATRNDEMIANKQKEVLRDALMMKLVSYYEDKYKLSHHETKTTKLFRRNKPIRHYDRRRAFEEYTTSRQPFKRYYTEMSTRAQKNINPLAEVVVI